MELLNIIDTIYESKYFPTVLIVSIIILVVLFTSVTILGIKDSKKTKKSKKRKIDDIIDITFDEVEEKPEPIKEDVTFEIPILTQNLENFKKSLEEEMEREEEINVIKETYGKEEETKSKKILDKKAIDSTDVLPIIEPVQEQKETIKEKEEKETHNLQNKEALKEIFKSRKEKHIEPPKLKEEDNKDNKKPRQQKYSGDDGF